MSIMNLSEARMAVRLESNMLDIASNMKKKYRGRMLCQACDNEEEETQAHLEVCEGYVHLRGNYDLDNMVDKSRFFAKLMIERAKNGRG